MTRVRTPRGNECPTTPVAGGAQAAAGGVLAEVGAATAQVSIAWLLHRSRTVLPIPGTTSVAHLEENVGAGSVSLSEDQFARLSAIAETAMSG
ncbi:aldo/keto reductase [Nocardia sp. NPDC059764]|uniref:aldo/keto reductase n=1 Tax=Nocardia sp. NPDC059764 TaxID=3346939 RepID=UPI0036572827